MTTAAPPTSPIRARARAIRPSPPVEDDGTPAATTASDAVGAALDVLGLGEPLAVVTVAVGDGVFVADRVAEGIAVRVAFVADVVVRAVGFGVAVGAFVVVFGVGAGALVTLGAGAGAAMPGCCPEPKRKPMLDPGAGFWLPTPVWL